MPPARSGAPKTSRPSPPWAFAARPCPASPASAASPSPRASATAIRPKARKSSSTAARSWRSRRRAARRAPSVEVRQLFFNLPARRKFLRTEETESAHIQHYLTLAALAYPEVAFTFQRDGRLVWQLPAVKTGSDAPARLAALRERLRALYGGEQKLLTVDYSAEMLLAGRSGGRYRRPFGLRTSDFGLPPLGFHRRARRLPLHPRRPAPLREPAPGGEPRTELRAARRVSHRADERALPGLLPVPGNRPGRRGREHPPGQARGEVSSGSGGAPAGGAGGPADAARVSRRQA